MFSFIHFKPRIPRRNGTQLAYKEKVLGAIAASTTTIHRCGGIHRSAYIYQISVSCSIKPISAGGTVLMTVFKYDSVANAEVALTTALDLVGIVTVDETQLLTFVTGLSNKNRTLVPGDTLHVKTVSNAAIGTAGQDIQIAAELCIKE